MATYTAAEMNGSGSVGEELTGVKQFNIVNPLNSLNNYQVGYLTLEGNSTANDNLSSTTFLTGSFGLYAGGINIPDKVFPDDATTWSVSISGDGGEFIFTPTTTIAQGSYYIKSTGLFTLEIV